MPFTFLNMQTTFSKKLPLNEFGCVKELMIHNSTQHPNILSISDFNFMKKGQKVYLELTLPHGDCTLADYLKKSELTTEESLQIIKKIVSAVDYLHQNGIFHGDIKTDNVMMMGDEPFLIDFGLSGFIDSENEKILSSTPFFCSPQCLQNKPIPTKKSFGREPTIVEKYSPKIWYEMFPIFYQDTDVLQNDIFSLGILISKFFLKIDLLPQTNDLHDDTWDLYNHFINNFRSIVSEHFAHAPLQNFGDILTKMIEPSQENRYKNLDEVISYFDLKRENTERVIITKETLTNKLKNKLDASTPSKYIEYITNILYDNNVGYEFFETPSENVLLKDLIIIVHHKLNGKF